MRNDIIKFCIIVAVASIFGWSIGYPVLMMLIASIGIIGWQLYQINLLYLSLSEQSDSHNIDSNGQLYLIQRLVNYRSRKSRLRKRKLSNYLKQFRKAASALPNAIVLIDSSGKITWANTKAETIFGVEWPSDKGVVFADLMRNQKIEKLLKNQSPHSEIEITSKLDSDITLNIQVVSHTDNLRMLIARDISRLVKTNKMQSDFVANVSHELKTPLTVLKGYLEIFQTNPKLTAKMIKPLQQMATQSKRMELIVQDLLYLAKLENKDDRIEHHPVDITHIINTIVETINDRLLEKQLKLELDIDYQTKLIGSDTELHAAFSNLIINAVNYTPKQGIIRVSWKRNPEGAAFTVKDNGEGIPENHLSRLTQRFYRVENDRSREKGGTGLGLSIVKHVLQRHNASLEINSTLGVGSEFKCLFNTNHLLLSEQHERTG